MMDSSMTSKIERAQEAEALRRVVSAYLNYSLAAEADICRWERSFAKLRPAHQALLSHLPKKYKDLRRCVSKNSYFINSMLQAFVPPFEMEEYHGWYGADEELAGCSHFNHGREVENRSLVPRAALTDRCENGIVSHTSLEGPALRSEDMNRSAESLPTPTIQDELEIHASLEAWASRAKCINQGDSVHSSGCVSHVSQDARALHSKYRNSREESLEAPTLHAKQSDGSLDSPASPPKRIDEGDVAHRRSTNCRAQDLSYLGQEDVIGTRPPPSLEAPGQPANSIKQRDVPDSGTTEQGNNSTLQDVSDASRVENAFGTKPPSSTSGASGMLVYQPYNSISSNESGDDVLNDPMEMGYQTMMGWFHPSFQREVSPADVDKVRCIVRNIVRDWTEEGAIERAQCYTPILEELKVWFPEKSRREKAPSCLIPGAGLARLACEISRLGFVSQGNEFSYFMMICSSFILNHTERPLEWVLHPWIHNNCNTFLNHDQLRAVRFPDLHPGSAGITEGFSMCAGDFLEVYGHPSQAGAWDAVVTCFFIDTAHNIVEYLEIISRILKPGGVWINVGPLLYHFADAHRDNYGASDSDWDEEMSMELSLADVRKIAIHFGLKMHKEKIVETTYSANIRAMMQSRYYAAFWTMVK